MYHFKVFLLQVADLYDIRKIIRNAKECKAKNDEMVACLRFVIQL